MNKYKENTKGIIINIKHGASKEGPGWRSIIYFKGCNFHCPWCGSPESIPFGKTELTYEDSSREIIFRHHLIDHEFVLSPDKDTSRGVQLHLIIVLKKIH